MVTVSFLSETKVDMYLCPLFYIGGDPRKHPRWGRSEIGK